MIRDAAGAVLALMGTLLIASAVEAPAGPGVAMLALVLAVVVALAARHCVRLVATPAVQPARWADPHPTRAGNIADPRRHPLRPRAPGQA